MTPTMEQPGISVAEWRVSLLEKGLMVNSGRSKVMIGSSGGNMIVNFENGHVRGLVVGFLDLWEERGVIPIFSYLENSQFHHTRLESLKHLIFVPFHIILSTIIIFRCLNDAIIFFYNVSFVRVYIFIFFLHVHFVCILCV